MATTFAFRAMGTRVDVVGADGEGLAHAARRVLAVFRREERRFSRFRADSELTAVNRRSGEWTSVTRPFAAVLDRALAAARDTQGAFDPTVHDALVAAGYDRDLDEVLAGARGALHPAVPCGGWTAIERRDDEIRLPLGVHLDLGGLAKGWTVDRAIEEAGAFAPWLLVNAGGDLRLTGRAEPIEVAIEDPEQRDRELLRLHLRDGALATSSICSRAWGPGAHHVIDPATGAPAATELLQATVWAATCADAEVAATHALLLGRRAADRLPTVLVVATGEVVVSMATETARAA